MVAIPIPGDDFKSSRVSRKSEFELIGPQPEVLFLSARFCE
jgi:hypothetical protein